MLYRRHPLYAALFLTSPARATKRPPNREPGLDFARLSPINYLREDHEETTLIPTSQPLSASLEAVVLRLMAVVLVVAVVAVVVVVVVFGCLSSSPGLRPSPWHRRHLWRAEWDCMHYASMTSAEASITRPEYLLTKYRLDVGQLPIC